MYAYIKEDAMVAQMAEYQVTKLKNWHEELVNFDLMHPSASLRMKAAHFNVSMSWISIVQNSDAYREYRAQRRDEHFGNVSQAVIDKLEALADISVSEINERIHRDKDIPLAHLTEVAEMALGKLGFGQKATNNGIVTNNNIIVADKEALEEARKRMRASQERIVQNHDRTEYGAEQKTIEILPPAKQI